MEENAEKLVGKRHDAKADFELGCLLAWEAVAVWQRGGHVADVCFATTRHRNDARIVRGPPGRH